ncbi:acyltransferase family protein [bacterium]
MTGTTTTAKPTRLLALDVFRGLTIAGMIVVNNQVGGRPYDSLRHAGWHGWTLADLVFPSFVFIMGVALAYSMGNRARAGQSSAKMYRHIAIRAIILFALGLLSTYDPAKGLAHIRIMGVLQRLALVYLFASVIAMNTKSGRGLLAWAVWLSVLYWGLMKLVPVPGYGAGDLSQAGNLAAYIDNLFLKGHLYTEKWDPEGLLHTLPAISSCLLGTLTGHMIRAERKLTDKIATIQVAGLALIILAFIANLYFPINKNLWSPAFVMLTCGIGMCVLGAFLWVIDFRGIKSWTGPFFVLGMNPLFAYLISGLMMTALAWPSVPMPGGPCENYKAEAMCPDYQGCAWDTGRNKCVKPGVKCKLFNMEPLCKQMDDCVWNGERKKCMEVRKDTEISLKDWLARALFFSWGGWKKGALFFSLAYVALWMGITGIMYKLKIFIKI